MLSSQPGLAGQPRASCVGTRRDGAVSIPAPHPSLPAAVVAARPTSITDAISAATSNQPPAMTSRRSPCGSPLAWRPFPDRLPRGARSPDLSAPRILAVTGPELSRTRNGGPEGRNGPAFRLPVLRATECGRSLAPGGRRAGHSALRPPGPFRLDSGTPCLVAVGAHTTEEDRTDQTVCSCRGERADHGSRWRRSSWTPICPQRAVRACQRMGSSRLSPTNSTCSAGHRPPPAQP